MEVSYTLTSIVTRRWQLLSSDSIIFEVALQLGLCVYTLPSFNSFSSLATYQQINYRNKSGQIKVRLLLCTLWIEEVGVDFYLSDLMFVGK
ncbi:hypothetical protein NC651_030169 [Populus alba x Populus x berolinensis]|nr:hypothetical protein NC651_030169 [Populus alba x Populus x berolinensis]